MAILGMGACVSNPATGIGRTSEPLRLEVRTFNDSTSHTEVSKVAEHTYRLDQVTDASVFHEWHYFQGKEEIDEQDYFRLAGDTDSVKLVRDRRDEQLAYGHRNEKFLFGGLGLFAVGLAIAVIGGRVDNPDTPLDPDDTKPSKLAYVGIGVGAIGGLGMIIGGIGVYTARNLLRTRTRADYEHATKAATEVVHCKDGTPDNPCLSKR